MRTLLVLLLILLVSCGTNPKKTTEIKKESSIATQANVGEDDDEVYEEITEYFDDYEDYEDEDEIDSDFDDITD